MDRNYYLLGAKSQTQIGYQATFKFNVILKRAVFCRCDSIWELSLLQESVERSPDSANRYLRRGPSYQLVLFASLSKTLERYRLTLQVGLNITS